MITAPIEIWQHYNGQILCYGVGVHQLTDLPERGETLVLQQQGVCEESDFIVTGCTIAPQCLRVGVRQAVLSDFTEDHTSVNIDAGIDVLW